MEYPLDISANPAQPPAGDKKTDDPGNPGIMFPGFPVNDLFCTHNSNTRTDTTNNMSLSHLNRYFQSLKLLDLNRDLVNPAG